MTNITTLPVVSKNGNKPEEKLNGKTTAAVSGSDKTTSVVKGPEKSVIEPIREMTMMERILKIENLQLIIDKRAKLVQTRSELERFQLSSNDFNCTMRLNDSDGNVFTTSFTPGIKKVIDFLKSSFEDSVKEIEKKITF